MISLQFENLNDLFFELENKVEGIKELGTRDTKTQISKAIFTITSKQFIKDFSIASAKNPKKYFHMYEWEKVGDPTQKLFKIKRQSVSGGDLKINLSFKKSVTPVPIPEVLKMPGKKGRVASKRTVFKNMAQVMEDGQPVTFTTKQYIIFLSQKDNKVHFVSPRHVVRIMNPGGKQTTNAFDKFATMWYSKKVDSAIRRSGMFQEIGKNVAKVLNQKRSGKMAAKEAIREITEKYAQGVIEL
jgi:hypothetical protein